MIDRARESRNPKKVIRVTLMESYGEIGRVPVNLSGTVSEECEMVQSCDSCILCGYATERSRKENGHYIKCIRRHTKESKKMDDKKV